MFYKKAFTMIELIMIIVVVGILSVIIIPRIDRNTLLEATNQIVSHIRYTQHLAMMDNKYNPKDPNWYKKRWMIEFTANSHSINNNDCQGNCLAYQIYSDTTTSGNLNSPNEVAKDPNNPNRYLSAGWSGMSNPDKAKRNPNLNIEKKYGIKEINFSQSCGGGTKNNNKNKSISFDETGRPMQKVATTGNYDKITYEESVQRYLNDNCTITLIDDTDKRAIITIYAETGYVTYKIE
ncbi:type II secretion system protein [Campylobacter ureolyticus]|uniref:Type II secretion system protein n=1 Tax=Campylobacter ureolyticus TaxID=827 RepID=A0A9Q4PSJ2_9BACT|nr:type II secretion system protein [Campylobacter ureolyticus]MCZ6160298.1 type II secretion system protein [Campylobacter ureolyticus]MCZ6164030.1 type II secretion system protein [Campylobacter ureolyticus]MCZ6166000.1 type II secretion system protein [Campylobacter ureolyticus]MCZ6167547.1 type II secretion system protein [Campylobacter ureolyticus]